MIWIDTTVRREIQTELETSLHEVALVRKAIDKHAQKQQKLLKEAQSYYAELVELEAEDREKILREKFKVLEKVAKLDSEIAKLDDRTAKLKNNTSILNSKAELVLGDYRGDYVLVECFEDAIVVHPDKTRRRLRKGPEREFLFEKMEKAGFIVIIARPSGWKNNYFEQVRNIVYEKITSRKKLGIQIGRASFPIPADADITAFLPAKK